MSGLRKLLMIGAPGVGKGTYARVISKATGLQHLATGDWCRDNINKGTPIGRQIAPYVGTGDLVPNKFMFQGLEILLEGQDGFILDGFPRNFDQIDYLDKIARPQLCVHLHTKDEVVVQKSISRRNCEECGEGYNLADIQEDGISMPPILPPKPDQCRCGGKLITRPDDVEEVVRGRLALYKSHFSPILEAYRERGIVKDVFLSGGVDVMTPAILDAVGIQE